MADAAGRTFLSAKVVTAYRTSKVAKYWGPQS